VALTQREQRWEWRWRYRFLELKKGLAEPSPLDGEHPPASVAAVETHD
jgi:hypothetical protein